MAQSHFLGHPDASQDFAKKFPTFLADCQPFTVYASRLAAKNDVASDFENALLSQCGMAWDLFAAVTKLVSTGFPVPAMTLARSLFETVMSGLYLADNPALLQDYLDHPRYVILKTRHKVDATTMDAQQLTNYQTFNAKFGSYGWYCRPIRDLASKVGLSSIYETVYAEASAITHGSSMAIFVPRYGVGTKDLYPTVETQDGRDYGALALGNSVCLIAKLFEKANLVCNLGYDDWVANFKKNMINNGVLSAPAPAHP